MTTVVGEAELFRPGHQPKYKIVLTFESKSEREAWLAAYYNSGEQEMMEAFNAVGNNYPDIKIEEVDGEGNS